MDPQTTWNTLLEEWTQCNWLDVSELAEALRTKFARASPQLLTFMDFPGEVEITNNASERALRPAVIQRKNTNGFRSMWAAQGDCAVRTVTDTAKISGQKPFQTITATLA